MAIKLRLGRFENWVKLEMNGYPGKEVPDYRVIQGELVAENPARGLIPYYVPDQAMYQLLSRRYEKSPVGVIQNAVGRATGESSGYFLARFPQAVVLTLMKGQDYPLVPCLKVNRMAYVRILDAVRNTILDWSLTLEKDGILGDGMSFTPQEKEVARKNKSKLAPVINIINIDNMTDSSIQQMSPGSTQADISG